MSTDNGSSSGQQFEARLAYSLPAFNNRLTKSVQGCKPRPSVRCRAIGCARSCGQKGFSVMQEGPPQGSR